MYQVLGHAHPSIKYIVLFQAFRYGLRCVYIFILMSLRQFLSCLPQVVDLCVFIMKGVLSSVRVPKMLFILEGSRSQQAVMNCLTESLLP